MSMNTNVNVVRIPATVETNFFKYWFEFLKPYHKLTSREIDVISELVKIRFQLSKVILDEDVLDSVLMSEDTKKKVREICKIKLSHFQVIMGKLRKHGIIVNDKINKRFIPNIKEEAKDFRLIFYFDLDGFKGNSSTSSKTT